MKKGINLLPSFETTSEKELHLKRGFIVVSTILLALSSLVIIILLIFQVRLKKELSEINGPIQQLEAEIENQHDKEAGIKVLKIKTGLAAKILAEPSPINGILDFLESNKANGIILSDISIPDTKKITFSGSSANALSFAELLKILLDSNAGRRIFSSLQLDSFSGGKLGDYQFSFSAKLMSSK